MDGSARGGSSNSSSSAGMTQASDVSTSLSHLSDAIGALAQNDTDAAKLLLHLCTQVWCDNGDSVSE